MKTLHAFFQSAALCAAIASLPLTTQAAVNWNDASPEYISTAETFTGTQTTAAGKVVTIQSGGSLTITSGSTLTLADNASIVVQSGGSLILGGGYLTFSAQASVNFENHLTISGNLDTQNPLGGTLSFDGTIDDNAFSSALPALFITGSTLKMTLQSNVSVSSLDVLANLVIDGNYLLSVSGALTIGNTTTGVGNLTSQVGTLLVNGALTINKTQPSAGSISSMLTAAGQLTAYSTITNNGALNLFNDGRLNVNNTLNNSGNIYLYTSNALNIDGQLNNSGNITVNDGSISVNGGTLKNTNPGTITFDGETFDLSTATLNNDGSIYITRGELLLNTANAVNNATINLSGTSTVSGRLSSGMLVKRTATDTTLFFSGVHDWTSALQSQYVKPGGKTTLNLRAGQDYLYITDATNSLTVPASHTLTIHNGGLTTEEALAYQQLRFEGTGTINNNGLLALTGGLTLDNLGGWTPKGFVRTPSPANASSTIITLYNDDPADENAWSQHLKTELENTTIVTDTLVVSAGTNLSFASGTLNLTIPTGKALRLNGTLKGGDNTLFVDGTLYRGYASAITFNKGKIFATAGKINDELNPLLKDSFPYSTADTTQYGVFLVNKGTEEEPAFLKKEEYTYTVNPNGTATIKGVEAKTNGQTGYYGTKVRPYKPVERITIGEQTVYLRVGEHYTPTVTIEPQTYTLLGKDTVNPNVEWLSSDNQVATVNPKTGELIAVGVGSAAIVVQTIGITAAEEQESAIELYGIVVRAVVKEVEITPGKREITGRDTTKWEVNVTPDDADPEYDPPYTTASEDLIAIEKHTPTTDYPFAWQVRVKKLVPNDTTIKITVQSKDAPEIKTDTELLLKYVRVDTVAIDTLSILTGDNQTFHWRTDQLQKGNYLLLSHTIKPDSAYYTTVSWQSLNEEVATVKDSLGKCKVTGLAPGETQIVVLTDDSSNSVIKSSDTLTIHVYEVELTEIKIGEYAKDKNGTLQNIAASELQMGEDWELTVTPQPPFSIPAGDYTWESSDPTTAEVNVVDGKVIVTGINPGTVDIRVYYNPNFEISDTVTLTIYTTNVSGVKILSGQQTVLPVHGIKELSATVIPQTATHKEITWKSSEDTIATVTDHGDGTAEVKALAPGTAYIYALSAEGNYKDSTKVTVVKVSVSKVTIDNRPKGDSLQLGTSFSYQCTVLPENASYPAVTWSSKNATIASVSSDGTVTGISKGNTVIYVTTLDGDKKDSVNLKIYPVKVSGVKINASSKTVAIGETLPLTAKISPDGVNESYTVTWESDNSAVAEVNNTGTVTGKTAGNALITVKVLSDNSEYSDTLTVTVYTVSVSGVMITGDKQITLPIGSSAQLTATVSPANASVKTLTWSSGDANIATVDNGGKVTALSWGDTYIYVFTSEGGYKDSVSVNVPPVAVNAIKISGGEQLTKGETMQLTATISPHNATNKSVTWKSENNNIATVDQNGLVTGISVGQTTIYVTAVENGLTDSAAITVTPIPVSGVTIAGDSEISLPIGATLHLSATVLPTNATNKSITWNTSNESVVAVSETGDLLAVTSGIAIITVTTTEGGYQSSVTITVHTVAVEGVTIQGLQTLSLPIGTEKQLTFTISPANATDQSVTWSSSDESVATVSETGMLTALSPGDASIYVTTTDGGLTDSVTVIVTPIPVNSVTIEGEASLSVPVGTNHELTATISPDNATDPTVTWSSSDETVALVSETGIITALSPGDATITVTTTDGGYKDSVWLTVTPTPVPVEGVKIEGTTDSVAVDSTVQFTVIVLPEDANVSYATSWESSDDSIASVNSDGIVTGRNEGKATLYVKVTTADSTYTDSVTIKVYTEVALPRITALEIISDSSWLFIITRPAGDPQGTDYGTLQLSAAITYTPADATIDEVVSAIAWSSGDTTVATVNNKGLVTAVGDGITPITLTVTEKATGKEVSVSLNVTIITSGIEPNVSPSSVKVYMADNTLYVNSAVAEKVTIYTISGQMLYSVNKPAGEIPIQLKNTPEGVLLICGASGWRSLVLIKR